MKILIVIALLLLPGCFKNTNPNNIRIGMMVTNGYCVGDVTHVSEYLETADVVSVKCNGFHSAGNSSVVFPLKDLKERSDNEQSDDNCK